jgi:hypothetical protein
MEELGTRHRSPSKRTHRSSRRALLAVAVTVVGAVGTAGPAGAATASRFVDITDGTSNTLAYIDDALGTGVRSGAAEKYTMFLPGGSPVAVAPTTAESFMDYTDDSVTRRGPATKSGGEVISDFAVDHPISSKEESL